ncbi:MAG: PAS domain S-box protein [Haloquadratum sp.]
MSDAPDLPDSRQVQREQPTDDATEGRVLLLLRHAENRRHLERWLREETGYTPVVVTDPAGARSGDLCVVDPAAIDRHREWIESCKATEEPRFFPVLLATAESNLPLGDRFWDVVDETITTPVELPELERRLENLLRRRRLSTSLADDLERTEARYETIFEAVNDALLIIDPAADGIVECNPRAEEVLGYGRSELRSLSPSEDLHGCDDCGQFRAFIDRTLSEGRARTDSLECVRKDGTVIETEVSASTVDSRDGDEPNVVFSIRDVTECREREREIQAQRDRLEELTRITRTLQETTTAVVEASDRDELERSVCGRLADSNAYRFAWIGERSGDGDVVPRALGGRAREYLRRVEITTEETPTGQGPTGDAFRTGEVAAVQNVATAPSMEPWADVLDEFGVRATAAVPIKHDGELFGVLNLYTAREEAFAGEEADILADLGRAIGRAISGIRAREEAETFQQAVEHTGHPIYLTDVDATIQYVNPAFERSTGYSREEAVGQTPRILKSGEHGEEFYRDLWETILSGERWESEVINQHKDGRRLYVDQTIAPIFDDGGEIDQFVAVNTEITGQRRRRQQLQVLYRVLRHNLRNELNVIDGYADLLGSGNGDAADDTDARDRIVDAVENLLRISDKARQIESTFSDGGAISSMKPLPSVVRRQKQTVLDPESDVSVSTSIPSTECRVSAELGTAIRELLENAVRHNDRESPAVRITVDVHADAAKPTATITVSDNGPGIPENEKRVLEEGEESPLLHGSGLGLWLVNWVVTELGGDVGISSNASGGTVVSITVPVRGP